MMMWDKLKDYACLMRLHRPIGILLLLWPTLWALWVAASGVPDVAVLLVFVLGVVVMRSAGCVINDIADRDFDPHVARTKDRPIASGRVQVREAVVLFLGLLLVALMLATQLDPAALMLAPIGAILATLYPFMKRYTHLPQVFLGAAFAWAIPMAFAAQSQQASTTAWSLYALTVLWALIYDTEYAMVDREDDLRIGVKSSAILFGRWDRAIIALLQVTMLTGLGWLGFALQLGVSYYAGLVLAGGSAVYQQWLIRQRIPADCFRAFLHNHWFGAAIFAGLALEYGVSGG
jgi:4-hydroxybenzoate polyprenyltransferase